MTQLAPRPTPGAPPGTALLPTEDPISRLPIVILYPHSRCNCRCVMCEIWRIKEKREITPADLTTWLPGWKRLGVRRVVLSGGEPLMHSAFAELGEALRGAGIGVTLLSTGLLLRRHAADVARYCDDVVVSLDGPEEVHDRIRNIPRAFAKLADGIRALRDRAADIAVSARCTVQRGNYRYLRDTVDAARRLGLDRVSFLAVDVSTEAFNRPGGWEVERVSEVALRAEDVPLLTEELAALERDRKADFESGFIAESPIKLRRRLLQYFEALLGRGDFHPNECNAPWVSTVIEVDGTVRPCFFHAPLGNVHDAGSLEAVLNSPKAIAWRRDLDVARNSICRRCVCSLALRAADEIPASV